MSSNSKLFVIVTIVAVAIGACNRADQSNELAGDTSIALGPADPQLTHVTSDLTYEATFLAMRSQDVPELPFPDNPDPSQCGIPTAWGDDDQAWLVGDYEGARIQDQVILYDSHLRLNIVTKAPHGSEVEIVLYQQNPVVDYYLVRIVGSKQPNEGWVPAPFLSFESVDP